MRSVLRLHLQQVLAIEVCLALCDLIERIAHEYGTQRRLARTVRTHDGMGLTIVDYQVNALQYLFVAYLGV